MGSPRNESTCTITSCRVEPDTIKGMIGLILFDSVEEGNA